MSIVKIKNYQIVMNEVQFTGTEVEELECMQFLGILFDDELSFENQVTKLVKESAEKINLSKRLSKNIKAENGETIYNSFMASNFDHCSTIYITCKLPLSGGGEGLSVAN